MMGDKYIQNEISLSNYTEIVHVNKRCLLKMTQNTSLITCIIFYQFISDLTYNFIQIKFYNIVYDYLKKKHFF